MDCVLPRRFIKLSAREVYDSDLSDALFRTLIQIRGLAYRFRGKRTPPLTVEDLMALRGRSRATIFKHLAALRTQGAIRIEPAGENAFVIYPLHRKRDNKRRKAAQTEGEATLPGARDDGTAGTAEQHHVAIFPLRWGSGAMTPAYERGDAAQAKHEGLPQPGLDGSEAQGMKPAGVDHGAARRRACLRAPAGRDPPPHRVERNAERGNAQTRL